MKKEQSAPGIMEMIHATDPYQGFDHSRYPLALDGWYSEDPVFEQLIDEVRPSLIIEVGTWKGASAIHMASLLKAKGMTAKIVCVDTWLGSVDFWTDQADAEKYLGLGLVNGYPSVYYQFLANVLHRGMQDYIVPFPQPSREACRWLELRGVEADICYVDGSHSREDVLHDLTHLWGVLNVPGALIGDDYDQHWPPVRSAVDAFVADNGLQLEVVGNKWIIRKQEPTPLREGARPLQDELRDLERALQSSQHQYLQSQKTTSRLEHIAEQHQRLQREHDLLKAEVDRLYRSRAVSIARRLQRHPGVERAAHRAFDLVAGLLRRERADEE